MIRLIGTRCKYSNVLSRGVLIVRFLLGNLKIKIAFQCSVFRYHLPLLNRALARKVSEFLNSLFSVGGLTQESHLFSFRTQKLSLAVSMILYKRGK